MRRLVQEKLQYTVTDESGDDAFSGWASHKSARKTKGTPSGVDAQFNHLPPGMRNTSQENADIREQKISRGNLGQGDQFTADVSAESLRAGFSKKPLSPTDGALAESGGFYDEISVDGKTGFLERRNVLDRG